MWYFYGNMCRVIFCFYVSIKYYTLYLIQVSTNEDSYILYQNSLFYGIFRSFVSFAWPVVLSDLGDIV